jgi:hypothetical protein
LKIFWAENISAASLTDPQTGQTYYLARIIMAKGAQLPMGKPLHPGMPAEVLIVTGERTAFSYLVEPLTRSLNRQCGRTRKPHCRIFSKELLRFKDHLTGKAFAIAVRLKP